MWAFFCRLADLLSCVGVSLESLGGFQRLRASSISCVPWSFRPNLSNPFVKPPMVGVVEPLRLPCEPTLSLEERLALLLASGYPVGSFEMDSSRLAPRGIWPFCPVLGGARPVPSCPLPFEASYKRVHWRSAFSGAPCSFPEVPSLQYHQASVVWVPPSFFWRAPRTVPVGQAGIDRHDALG